MSTPNVGERMTAEREAEIRYNVGVSPVYRVPKVTDDDIAWLKNEEWQDRERAADLAREAAHEGHTPSMSASAMQQSRDYTSSADRYARILSALGGAR